MDQARLFRKTGPDPQNIVAELTRRCLPPFADTRAQTPLTTPLFQTTLHPRQLHHLGWIEALEDCQRRMRYSTVMASARLVAASRAALARRSGRLSRRN